MAATVVIADDQIKVRQGLRDIISEDPELTVVGEAESGHGTINLVGQLRPDILVLDPYLNDIDGMDVIRRLQIISPETDIIIYSMYDYASYLIQAKEQGVNGYVLKKSPPYEIIQAIKSVLAGLPYFPPPLPSGE